MGDVKDAVTGATEKTFSGSEVFDAVTGRRMFFWQDGYLYSAINGRKVAIVTGAGGGTVDPNSVITVEGVIDAAGNFRALDLSGSTIIFGDSEADFDPVLYVTGMNEVSYAPDAAETSALPGDVIAGKTFVSGNRLYIGNLPRATYSIEDHTVHLTAGYIPADVDIIVPCSGTEEPDPEEPGTDPEDPDKDYRYTVYGAGDEVVNGDYYLDYQDGGNVYLKNANGIVLYGDAFDYWYFRGDLGSGETEIWSQGRPNVQADPTTIPASSWLYRDGTAPPPTIVAYGTAIPDPDTPGIGDSDVEATAEDLIVSGCGLEAFNGVYKIQTSGSTGTSRVWVHTSGASTISWSGGFFVWYLREEPNDNGDENDFLNYTESDPTATWHPAMSNNNYNPPTVKFGGESGGVDFSKVTQFKLAGITPEVDSDGFDAVFTGSTFYRRKDLAGYDYIWADAAELGYNKNLAWNDNLSRWELFISGPGAVWYTTEANPFTATSWTHYSGTGNITITFSDIVEE